jgi:hypothetical protein
MISARLSAIVMACVLASTAHAQASYRLLATSKTSTMQKEMQEAGDAGFHFVAVMGGETAIGGKETVVLMEKAPDDTAKYSYRLLATTKDLDTSEGARRRRDGRVQRRRADGVRESHGRKGDGRDRRKRSMVDALRYECELIATSKTSTLQKEMQDLADQGFRALGMAVAKTALGGNKIVVITRRIAK